MIGQAFVAFVNDRPGLRVDDDLVVPVIPSVDSLESMRHAPGRGLGVLAHSKLETFAAAGVGLLSPDAKVHGVSLRAAADHAARLGLPNADDAAAVSSAASACNI